MSRRRCAGVAALALMLAALGGCSKPLPEEASPAAQLYALRCGNCHAAYHPQVLTAAMWKVQVDRMAQKAAGVRAPVPTPQERTQILEYLARHAGH